jgi:hypothetical protein
LSIGEEEYEQEIAEERKRFEEWIVKGGWGKEER